MKLWRGGEYDIKEVFFQAEELSNGTYCFLIQMPEQQNHIFEDINVAEDKQGYAISVVYNPSANITLQSWMIDGITNRE